MIRSFVAEIIQFNILSTFVTLNYKLMPNNIFIALGSNIEPRKDYLLQAIEQIKAFAEVLQISSFIETEPMGFEADMYFINAVIEIQTELKPMQLLTNLKDIEIALGRKSKSKNKQYSSRTIDLDILYYNQTVITSPHLTIPHPEIYNRDFVTKPLAEIANEFIDPLQMKTINDLIILQ